METSAAGPDRPERGARFTSRNLLNPGAEAPYGPGDYAVQVVTATRSWNTGPGDITVYYTSADLYDDGDHHGIRCFDLVDVGRHVREWL
jgi:hypothetical protein